MEPNARQPESAQRIIREERKVVAERKTAEAREKRKREREAEQNRRPDGNGRGHGKEEHL